MMDLWAEVGPIMVFPGGPILLILVVSVIIWAWQEYRR